MFSHIMIGSNDIEKSKKFYDQVLGVLGAKEGVFMPNLTGQTRYFYFLDKNTFCITEPIDGNQAHPGNGNTVAFNVPDEETGNKWHSVGLEYGGTSIEDAPGVREYENMKMFLAYLKDPSGNKICAIKIIK